MKLYEERCGARALQVETRRLEKCKTLRWLQTDYHLGVSTNDDSTIECLFQHIERTVNPTQSTSAMRITD